MYHMYFGRFYVKPLLLTVVNIKHLPPTAVNIKFSINTLISNCYTIRINRLITFETAIDSFRKLSDPYTQRLN